MDALRIRSSCVPSNTSCPVVLAGELLVQASGRSKISRFHRGHIIKPCDRKEELTFYRSTGSLLQQIIPKSCLLIQNGQLLLTKQTCSACQKLMECTDLVDEPRSSVVLEDLTFDFKKPCVLDIKLGTRTHPDSADEETAARKTAKCIMTTSSSLGLRFEGMNVWTEEGLVQINKMNSPSLRTSAEKCFTALLNFFEATRSSDKVLKEVKFIKEVIQKLDGYRFFASSLLIVAEPDGSLVKVKLVDFAKATIPGILGRQYQGPDDGCLKGLTTIEHLLS